ncbi:MAG: hypothetical protein ACPG5U_02100 [Planktomarina sp.]
MPMFLKPLQSIVFFCFVALTCFQTIRVTQLNAEIVAQQQIDRLNIKAKLRRLATSIPGVGFIATGIFERNDRADWLAENPTLTDADYICWIAANSSLAIVDVAAEFGVSVEFAENFIPKCER